MMYPFQLHFAAGYNRVAVVEYLLQHGASVNMKDQGGLYPIHNVSVGRMDFCFECCFAITKNSIQHSGMLLWPLRSH